MSALNTQGRPQRPPIGPQAHYSITGTNIGTGTSDPVIRFEDGGEYFHKDLEWALQHLEEFDEPSRHMILAGTAVHFGMPFEDVMGGLL